MVTPCHKFRFDFYRCYYFLGESPRISAGSGYPRLSVLLRRSADRTRPSAGRSYPFPGQRAGPVETLHLEERKARRNPAKGSEQRLIRNPAIGNGQGLIPKPTIKNLFRNRVQPSSCKPSAPAKDEAVIDYLEMIVVAQING